MKTVGGMFAVMKRCRCVGLGLEHDTTSKESARAQHAERPRRSRRGRVEGEYRRRARGAKPRPVARAGLTAGPAQSPFCLRLRDQMRLKVSPSSTRLA